MPRCRLWLEVGNLFEVKMVVEGITATEVAYEVGGGRCDVLQHQI